MDYEALMRRQIARLVQEAGILQKKIGDELEMSQATVSRWLREEDGVDPPSILALERLNAFARKLKQLADEVDHATRLPNADDPMASPQARDAPAVEKRRRPRGG